MLLSKFHVNFKSDKMFVNKSSLLQKTQDVN